MPDLKKDAIVLNSIILRRDSWRDTAVLTGTAEFSNKRGSGGESVSITITLSTEQIAAIVRACGDSLKIEAQKKAQAFYENAAELVGRILEDKSGDKMSDE